MVKKKKTDLSASGRERLQLPCILNFVRLSKRENSLRSQITHISSRPTDILGRSRIAII